MIVCLWFILSVAQFYYFKGLCQCQMLSNIVHSGLRVFWVGTSCVHCQHIPVFTVINTIVLFFATLFWHVNDVNSNNNNKFTLVWINITKLTTSFKDLQSLDIQDTGSRSICMHHTCRMFCLKSIFSASTCQLNSQEKAFVLKVLFLV